MKMIFKCEEVNHSCDKSQYKEATFWEKVKLNIHLIFCELCRKYSARNAKLSNAIYKGDIKTMPTKDKLELKEVLRKEIAK